MKKKLVRVNLNDAVRFKLTPSGHRKLIEINTDNARRRLPAVRYPVDRDGWCKTQLWDLALVFGPHFSMGFDPVIETTIVIEVDQPMRKRGGR